MTGDTRTRTIRPADRPSSAPKVSFIIPCYNGRAYLEECLSSIVSLTDLAYEALVVDDGSTEDIRDIVERFAPAVSYLRQSNQGPGSARNTGTAATSGAYLWFLDADDVLLTGTSALRRQVALLDTYPEVGLVYGQALKIDSQGRPFALRKPPFARSSYVRSGDVELRHLLFGNYITTSAALVRRTAISAAGGFRTDIIGPEDWDCWLRLARVASIAYVAEPAVAYRIHEKSITAHYTPLPWLEMHADILDRCFADPAVAQRYGALRPLIDGRLYASVARTAYTNRRMDYARDYAGRALRTSLGQRQWRATASDLWLIAKSLVPATLHQPLRRASRRSRRAGLGMRVTLPQPPAPGGAGSE